MTGERREDRGRHAHEPGDIPAPGWRDILLRVRREVGSDHATLVAAGLAMYALLAVFPALAAAVSIYGLFASPREVVQHMQAFAGVLPPGAWELFSQQLQNIAASGRQALTVGVAISLLIALWSARSGMASLITATNIAYKQPERRSFIIQMLQSLAFTIGAVLGFLAMVLLGVAVPLALEIFGAHPVIQVITDIVRWALLWLMAAVGLSILYRYGPDRARARWHWVSWGSAIAATLWLAGSLLFALYVRNFGSYGKTYGALGGVIVLLMWFYISAFVVVLGAEVNAEMERQTERDTTEGHEKPLGERGAYAADTVGPVPR